MPTGTAEPLHGAFHDNGPGRYGVEKRSRRAMLYLLPNQLVQPNQGHRLDEDALSRCRASSLTGLETRQVCYDNFVRYNLGADRSSTAISTFVV